MGKGSCRCSECRRSFVPEPSARKTQRVCGGGCRQIRDRRLARTRRKGDLEHARRAERRRQRVCRARRAVVECHAPASASKSLVSQELLVVLVDQVLAESRASLVFELSGIIEEMARRAGIGRPVSRGGLGAEDIEITPDSAPILADVTREVGVGTGPDG